MISPLVLARRVLGRHGTFLLRTLISTVLYYAGLYEYADSTSRENGISVLMCTCNEEDWVELAILSVKDLADEIVVVDSSSDRTPEIVKHVAESHGINLRLVAIPPGDFVEARLQALKYSTRKWLMQMDADMVLHEDAPQIIRSLIESLDPRRHYLVYWKYLLLCGDLEHVCGKDPYHVEHWLYTYSRDLTYKYLDFGGGVYMDALIAPVRFYKPVFLNKVLGVHLTGVRSPEKHALKHIRLKHRRELLKYLKGGLSPEDALVKIAREHYGTEDLRELGLKLLNYMVKELPRYDPGVHGPLPRLLMKYYEEKYRAMLGR